jgi:hypothetical protein
MSEKTKYYEVIWLTMAKLPPKCAKAHGGKVGERRRLCESVRSSAAGSTRSAAELRQNQQA